MTTQQPKSPVRHLGLPTRALLSLMAALAFLACEGAPGAGSLDATGGGEPAPSSASEPGRAPATAPTESEPGTSEATADTQRVNISDLGINTGEADAPIQVVEFSDFGCPHCREFHLYTYPTLQEEYVETGKVIWKYVPMVLGTFPNSLEATRAGYCALEQDAFPAMRDRLFQGQREWMTTRDPRELFLGYARDVGLDVEPFRGCLEEGRSEESIRETLSVARDVGIQGTPTFFIEGQKLEGNRPVDFFRQVFDRMLEEQEATGADATGPGGR